MSDFISQIDSIFSKEGLLSKISDFEYRVQQQQMAVKIAESLENNSHEIIEAPTGIGKSFSYLIPSILFSLKEKRKAIVSTCTINLQEQLINKDIPALKKILPYEFKSEILKGRNNYICSRRLNNALIRQEGLFIDEQQNQLRKIHNFVQKNNKGTRQDISFKIDENVWTEIYAEQGICTSKSCGTTVDSNCFYQRAKQELNDADIIILNHYLFFTLLGLFENRSDGYIYANDFAVFDEAHFIEQIAAENVSPSVSKEMIRFWLHKLYNPKTNKGFLILKRADRLVNTVRHLLNETDYFFDLIENYIFNKYPSQRFKKTIRVREPLNIPDDFSNELIELCNDLKKMPASNSDEENEINNYWNKFTALRNTINDFIGQKMDDFVYWVEFSARRNVKFCNSPINMADFFRDNIFTDNRFCIMTSATLSINNSLDYFKKTIGAEVVKGIMLDSPFDFQRQMKIHVASKIPTPIQKQPENATELLDSSEYEKILTDKIYEYVLKTAGGALVLFTNFKLLNHVYSQLCSKLMGKNIVSYAQGNSLPNNKMLNEFIQNYNSVLFGVDSFWMGVDVPGGSLRNVIITKLPFDVPDDPITEAKMEIIQERGGNPFFELTLPNAVLKFKQGTGRLIRNKTDEGILVVLDSRILNKFYGKWFINSLPECEIIVD